MIVVMDINSTEVISDLALTVNGRLQTLPHANVLAIYCCSLFPFSFFPLIAVSFCTLPSNMEVSNRFTNVAIGEEVILYCTRGYKLSNSLKLFPALCDCNSKWNITTNHHNAKVLLMSCLS